MELEEALKLVRRARPEVPRPQTRNLEPGSLKPVSSNPKPGAGNPAERLPKPIQDWKVTFRSFCAAIRIEFARCSFT